MGEDERKVAKEREQSTLWWLASHRHTLTRNTRANSRLSSCTDIIVAVVRGAETREGREADQLLHTHTHVNEGERMKASLG